MRKRAAKEAQTRMLAAYQAARVDLEADEERTRAHIDVQASAHMHQVAFAFFHALVAPRSRMMIPRPLFEELRLLAQRDAQVASQRSLELQREQRRLEEQNLALQEELRALRRDFRALGQAVDLHCRKEQSAVLGTLQEAIKSLDESISLHRAECAESPHLLNRALEESRLAHREFVSKALDAAAQITLSYTRSTPYHTRIPTRIRDRLRHSSVEDLMLTLDTLSFEDGVLQYLLHLHPPPKDDPVAAMENPFG